MTNPAPRPALRKAPDADLHPARANQPTAVDLRSRVAANYESPVRPPLTGAQSARVGTPPDAARPRAESSSMAASQAEGQKSASKKSKKDDKKKKKGPKSKKKKGKGARSSSRSGQRIDLRVAVPQPVRRALRTQLKARGTSVDETVSSVIAGLKPA